LTGVDTVDFTTEWAMSFLLNHPQRLEKVKAKIDREVGHEHLVQLRAWTDGWMYSDCWVGVVDGDGTVLVWVICYY